ncbi:MAG: hypothetical protein QM820_21565 [Minicystis sp.]
MKVGLRHRPLEDVAQVRCGQRDTVVGRLGDAQLCGEGGEE